MGQLRCTRPVPGASVLHREEVLSLDGHLQHDNSWSERGRPPSSVIMITATLCQAVPSANARSLVLTQPHGVDATILISE